MLILAIFFAIWFNTVCVAVYALYCDIREKLKR